MVIWLRWSEARSPSLPPFLEEASKRIRLTDTNLISFKERNRLNFQKSNNL